MGHKEYVHRSNGRVVIDTKHAFSRAIQRGTVSKVHASRFLEDMVVGCLANKDFMAAPDNTEWFVFNRQLQQGIVVAFRRDYRSRDRVRAFVIVTAYPYGVSRPAQSDTKTIYV
jgi:hypothetical protein